MVSLYPIARRIVLRIKDVPTRGLPRLNLAPSPFDQEYGVETTRMVWLTSPFAKNFGHGVRYQGCNPESCNWAIRAAAIDSSEFSFIDMGCGKGRPLIIASRHEFAQLIGVDYSWRLCRCAARNLKRCGVDESRYRIVHMDAGEFQFPQQNLFVYFYNPFDGEVLARVMKNLHLASRKSRVFVGFEGPNQKVLEGYPWLHKVAQAPHVTLFGVHDGDVA